MFKIGLLWENDILNTFENEKGFFFEVFFFWLQIECIFTEENVEDTVN